MPSINRVSRIALASVLLAGCAGPTALVAPRASDPAPAAVRQAPGTVTVPIALPAARSTQNLYNNNYINTVEVRLRDSLGNVFTQYVARNAYLAGSTAAGTINVTFTNVMPGVFTLNVRTSHIQLLSANGPVKYDDLRDVFFIDQNGNNAYDVGEPQINVISGNKTTNFVVFGATNIDPTTVFPNSVRQDTTPIPAGYGIGGATQSIIPGQTTTVPITVSQPPTWGQTSWSTVKEVTAGDIVSYNLATNLVGTGSVAAGDTLLIADPGVQPTNGYQDLGNPLLNWYLLTVDNPNSTMSFQPTRGTYSTLAGGYVPWNAWLARGAAVGEIGLNNNLPQITVLPALANSATSRAYVTQPSVSANRNTTIQYDVRDVYNNPVTGNVAANQNSLSSLRRQNAGITMDYAVTAYTYGIDPTTVSAQNPSGLNPFILPGRTTGFMAGPTYNQGSTLANPVTVAATYSALSAASGSTPLGITRLEVPYYIWNANQGAFPAFGPHVYTLTVQADPTQPATNYWVALMRGGWRSPRRASRTRSRGRRRSTWGCPRRQGSCLPRRCRATRRPW